MSLLIHSGTLNINAYGLVDKLLLRHITHDQSKYMCCCVQLAQIRELFFPFTCNFNVFLKQRHAFYRMCMSTSHSFFPTTYTPFDHFSSLQSFSLSVTYNQKLTRCTFSNRKFTSLRLQTRSPTSKTRTGLEKSWPDSDFKLRNLQPATDKFWPEYRLRLFGLSITDFIQCFLSKYQYFFQLYVTSLRLQTMSQTSKTEQIPKKLARFRF